MINWIGLPLCVTAAHAEALARQYATPTRHYHTLFHIGEMLGHYRQVSLEVGWLHPREVLAALLYHDAVYAAGSPDNEVLSAALATVAVSTYWAAQRLDVARVEALILLTAEHGKLASATLDADEALFVDCDMAILAAPWRRFCEYDAQIAKEYAAIPEEVFRSGRRGFFERLRASQRIFMSRYFWSRLEAQARANMGRSLAHP